MRYGAGKVERGDNINGRKGAHLAATKAALEKEMTQKLFFKRKNLTLWLLPVEVDAVTEAGYRARKNRSAFILEAIKDKIKSHNWDDLVQKIDQAHSEHESNRWKRFPKPSIAEIDMALDEHESNRRSPKPDGDYDDLVKKIVLARSERESRKGNLKPDGGHEGRNVVL